MNITDRILLALNIRLQPCYVGFCRLAKSTLSRSISLAVCVTVYFRLIRSLVDSTSTSSIREFTQQDGWCGGTANRPYHGFRRHFDE